MEEPPSAEWRTSAARTLLKAAGMISLLTALVLAASPEVPNTENPAPAEPSAPRRAFWVQPIGTALLGLPIQDSPALYLPLGANLPVWEDSSTSLGVELTVVTGSMRSTYEGNSSRPVPNYWRVLAAVGPVFSLTGRPLSGPFVQPKLLTNFSYEPEYGYDMTDHSGGPSVEVQLGLDLGWQFTSGNWYIAPVLGASVGYGFNMPLGGGTTGFEPSRVLPPQFVGYETRRGASPVIGINLNLLRLGAVF